MLARSAEPDRVGTTQVGSAHSANSYQENTYMSRQFISSVIILTTLTLCSAAPNQPTDAARKPQPAQGPAAQRQNSSAEQQWQKLQARIDDLRADHQALIDQLTALRA